MIKIYSNKHSFKEVIFNKTGLNFILAKQKNEGKREKGKTYNGVGKSLLISLIHFCLGSSTDKYKILCEKLPEWEFYLDFEIDNIIYTSKRLTNDAKKIYLNEEILTIDRFNNKMASLCFDIQEDEKIKFLTFRSLIPFFIRPNRLSYNSFDKPTKYGNNYQPQLLNSYLLGLDYRLADRKYNIRKEQAKIKDLGLSFKKDSLLKDFFTGDRNVSITIRDLEENINKLSKDLSNFKVAENYYDVQVEADNIENELSKLNNKIILSKNNINQIDETLKISPDISKENIEKIYNESKIYFSERLTKTLSDMENFYDKLLINRKDRLLKQRNKLKLEIDESLNKTQKLKKELDKLLKYIGDHGALDVFLNLTDKLSGMKIEYDKLKKYQELESEYESRKIKTKQEILEIEKRSIEYLNNTKDNIDELSDYYRDIAKRFYNNSVAGLSIDVNSGENQINYKIDARIESDGSDGINNIKIFCYDMTLLFKGYNHNINFLFHDSRIFHGTDDNQKKDLFKIINERFTNTNKQYIVSVNQNQIDEVKKHLTEEEYKSIIKNNIILNLTDDSDNGKLLGITVDIGNI